MQAAEHVRRPGDVAAGEGAADRRRAERLAHPVEPLDQLDRADDEVVAAAELLEQVDVARDDGAEVEVLADDDRAHARARDEDAMDERLRRLVRLVLVERQHDGGVDAGRGEQLEALLRVREQLRRRLRADDHRRVTVERQHHRPGAVSSAAIARTWSMTAWWPRWTPS